MLKMQVLGLIAFLLSVAAAQLPLRFQSSGFQNNQGSLSTSATRGRPFISIPIVLLPDGQAVTKPRHTNYEYAGKSEGRRNPRQNSQRNQNSQNPIISKPATNYQVAVPPTTTLRPTQKKQQKIPKLTQQQLSGQIKHLHNNQPKHNIPTQNFQQKLQQRPAQLQHQQTQNVPHVQQQKQQRIPLNRHAAPNQQSNSAHKQNVVNFVSFAANLGATITSPQQNGQQQTQHQFRTETQYQPQQANKPQGNFYTQKQAPANNRPNIAAVSQAQVPSFPAVQHSYDTQVAQNIPPVKQSSFLIQHQAQQSQNQHTQSNPSNIPSHYTETAPVSKQTPAESNSQANNNYQSASLQNSNAAMQFSGSHSTFGQGNSNAAPSLHTYQQNYAGSVANPQVILPQKSVLSFETHQQLPKTHSQSMSSDYMVNAPSVPVSYTNQNHGSQYNFASNSQPYQNTFAGGAETFPGTYAAAQNVASTIIPSQQSLESNLGSSNSQEEQLSSYQSAQSMQESYAPSVNSALSYSQIPDSAQTSYLGLGASENPQANYVGQINQEQPQISPAQQNLDSTYSLLGNNQFLYSLGGQSVYSTGGQLQQQADIPSNQQPAVGVQTQDSFTQEQPSYTVNGQQTQVNYISSPQVDKNYQTPTYNYEIQSQQDEAESQDENQQTQSDTPSGDSQLIYASSAGKQINYSPSPYTYSPAPQQFSSSHLQSSPTYVSFTTSNSGLKPNSATTNTNYGNQPTGVITPGSSYAKLAAQSNISSPKQPESASEQQSEDDDEYEGEDEEEEASYKVVYIPLDILKNILSNSVETKK